MRKTNVALRWRLLHRLCTQTKFKDLLEKQVNGRAIIDLLLRSAQLEFKVNDGGGNGVALKREGERGKGMEEQKKEYFMK